MAQPAGYRLRSPRNLPGIAGRTLGDGAAPGRIGQVSEIHQGLSAAEVARRVAAGQVNDLPPRSGRTTRQIIRANVFTRINSILAVLFVLVASTGSFQNGLFALLIVINSIVGMVQEMRAKRTLDKLAIIGEARPMVRRDGVAARVDRRQIVLDDVIELAPGDQVIVDGEVLESQNLEIDESLLTGESDAIDKAPGSEVMSGSFVVAGSGAYRATRVGADAYAAQLAEEAARYTLVDSELRSGINQILKWVTYLLIPVGILTIWVQVRQLSAGRNEALLNLVAALVPMVPEGLVLLTSVAFAVGVIRLGRQGCLVQELPAIEGLARVDTLCVDKTGTLTAPGLSFGTIELAAGVQADEGQVREWLAQLAATDSHSNATMAAIAAEVGVPDVRWPAVQVAPFTSRAKWSGATFEPAPGRPGSLLLGAVDVLAAPGSAVAEQAEALGSGGLRVVGLARDARPVDRLDDPSGCELIALITLAQKVRPDAAETVEFFRAQGVQLKVISGDNASSVAAVARRVGIGADDDIPVDARSLSSDTAELADQLDHHSVFGRVSPQQKRAMVGALQSRGHVVAMTGDGVNDVLALKDADVGVAMGSGSEASRSAAQIVLLSDSFASLPAVVAEGRRVIGNIERVAALFLTKTFYSVLLALLVGVAQLPFPFVPLHVTITAWFTIGVPAFFLAMAPNSARAFPGFARRALARSAPAGIAIALTTFGVYVLLRQIASTASRTEVSTACLLVVIGGAMRVLVKVTNPDKAWKWALILGGVGAYAIIFSVPQLAKFFMLDATNPLTMAVAAGGVLVATALSELGWRLEWRISGRRRRFLSG